MKINLHQTFKSLDGKEIKITEEGKTTKFSLTLGAVLSNVVLAPHRDKKGFRPLRAVELARELYNKKEIELSDSDLMQIRELVENGDLMPIISGQILEFLEE